MSFKDRIDVIKEWLIARTFYIGESLGKTSTKIKRLLISISLLLAVITIVVLVFSSKYVLLSVDGHSMQPSYRTGDILLCEKGVSILKHGDVVNIDMSDEDKAQRAGASDRICKRVIALEGDTLRFDSTVIYLNGRLLNEPYVYLGNYRYTSYEDGKEFIIPEGCVFVMGDNRAYSLDSRTYGVVHKSNIQGKVVKNLTKEYNFSMRRVRVTIAALIALTIVLFIGRKLKNGGTHVIHRLKGDKNVEHRDD